jgi:PAS domain-containing protein
VAILDRHLRVVSMSRSFAGAFGMAPEEARGHTIVEVLGPRRDTPELRKAFEPHAASPLEPIELRLGDDDTPWWLRVRRVRGGDEDPHYLFVLALRPRQSPADGPPRE